MAPTPTLPDLLSHLLPRQQAVPPAATVTVFADPPAPPATTIVTTNSGSGSSGSSDSGGGGSSLDTGSIVGIVIGTIVGLILIWWIVKSLSGDKKKDGAATGPAPDTDRQGWYDDRAGAVHGRTSHSRHRSRDHHRSHRHHSRHRSSTPRPVVVVDDTKYAEPRRPSGTYVVPMGEVRRSRSQARSRSPGYYARY